MVRSDNYEKQLDQAKDIVINGIGETMDLYGINRSVGNLYGTMVFEGSMTLDEMREQLQMSKPSMSAGVKKLQEFDIVKQQFTRGSRKQHFIAEKDFFIFFNNFFSRKWDREISINMDSVKDAEILLQKIIDADDVDEETKEELAELETLDTGKTLEESYADMDDIHNVFMYFAGLAGHDGGEIIDSPIPHSESKLVKEPVGVVTQITPWNYPLLQASWKIAPALVTGCSLVMKPSEITPLTTIRVFELMEQVGFPNGVINLVLGKGSEVGEVLASHKEVDLVSFTGGI